MNIKFDLITFRTLLYRLTKEKKIKIYMLRYNNENNIFLFFNPFNYVVVSLSLYADTSICILIYIECIIVFLCSLFSMFGRLLILL